MKLIDIETMVHEDTKPDDNLDYESVRTPQLHNKYLKLYNAECGLLRKLNRDYDKLYKVMWEYYSGKISQEDMKTHGMEPFGLKILKGDLHIYLDSDEKLSSLKERVEFQKQKCKYIEDVLKEICRRSFTIKNAIDWKKYVNGVV